nr:LPS-assembly protein LptD [Sphingomonas daechungensis]
MRAGRKRVPGAGYQHLARPRLRSCPALLQKAWSEPRPDADAACLHEEATRHRSALPRAEQPWRVPDRRVPHLWPHRGADGSRRTAGDRRKGHPGLFRCQRQVPAQSTLEHHRLDADRDRQDCDAALRHYPRRPSTQLHQRRTDRSQQLHLDCRLGFSGAAGRRRAEAHPIALPAIDARFRIDPPALGGVIELQANSLAITRIEGQDTQRAFASARWDIRKLTNWGQEVVFTAYARGDVYHTSNAASTLVPLYRGVDGWHTRGIGALATDVKWPFVGPLFGGSQRLTPRVQLVFTPATPNLDIPNEDARAVDLEDSNLFALNRFPGYDRWEDGSRITYGLDWSYDRPNLSIVSTIGQSYRISKRENIFPDGTGLSDRVSDIVGRTRIRFGRFIDLTHRYRLDKENFAVRRNELDLTVGGEETYAQIGYLRLNRDIDEAIEDLRDKEELRAAARIKFAKYWSIFGATVLDLTGKAEDPLSVSDGYEPVRHRLSIDYEDDCIALGVSWRRDYERVGGFNEGSTFSFRVSFKGLGR